MLISMIKAYRRWSVVNKTVRIAVMTHHRLVPASRTPCTLADCSGTGLTEAQALGWKALPGILGRMAACGPSAGIELPDCKDPFHGSVESNYCLGPDAGCLSARIGDTPDCLAPRWPSSLGLGDHSGPTNGCRL
jgi:hypothetical protein